MTVQEAREAVKELLENHEPLEVAEGFYQMYLDGKIEFEDLEFLVGECGYDLSDEFKNASDEERKTMYKDEDEEEIEEDLFEEDDDKKEEGEEGEVVEEEERASTDENYDGEKVYDKKGNPVQKGSDEGTEQEQAEKLYNLKF